MGEVYLTEIQTELLAVFVKRKILDDDTIRRELHILAEKLKTAKVVDD